VSVASAVIGAVRSGLPRQTVDVLVKDRRVSVLAAIDSCSEVSLATPAFVSCLGLKKTRSDLRLQTMNGGKLDVLGKVNATIAGLGDFSFTVIPGPLAVDCQLVIGSDIIKKHGVWLGSDDKGIWDIKFGVDHQPVSAGVACSENSTVDDGSVVKSETIDLTVTLSDSDIDDGSAGGTSTAEPEMNSYVDENKHCLQQSRLLRGTTVETADDGGITLSADVVVVKWHPSDQRWGMSWVWKSQPPEFVAVGPPNYGFSDSEHQFVTSELKEWLSSGVIAEYDPNIHGDVKCTLPLVVQDQSHKSTQRRLCIDFRRLNCLIKNSPGREAPACDKSIRKWRKMPETLITQDIRKAFLNISVDPALYPYLIVEHDGVRYVIQRMAFGLAPAPKCLQMVLFYLFDMAGVDVDSYVDDLVSPDGDTAEKIRSVLEKYSFPLKPPEGLGVARLLGLQTFIGKDNKIW
jgi:hypothetical protein